MTIKVTRKFSGGGDPVKWFEALRDRIEEGNREVLEDGIEYGARKMKEYISTRATPWVRENLGREGRIKSGRMIDSVDHKVTDNSKNHWSGAFGWTDEQKTYFLTQELGGENTITGGEIEAMYAMRDAAAEEWEVIQARIKENIENA